VSISSSNSTLDSNNLDNHDKVQVKKDENNSDETLDNFIGIKNHVENVGVSRNLRIVSPSQSCSTFLSDICLSLDKMSILFVLAVLS
jgi:hypothetical protein